MTTLVRPLTDAEQSAQHLAGELEQLLRTIHPDDQSDAEAVHDAIAYVMAARECLADVGTADGDDAGEVTP